MLQLVVFSMFKGFLSWPKCVIGIWSKQYDFNRYLFIGCLHCMAYNLCFYGCCCVCGLGLWPECDFVFSVLICLCIYRLEKADWQIAAYTLHILLSVLLWWMPELLLHASVDKEVCFLSGKYVCSCQQVGQKKSHFIWHLFNWVFLGTRFGLQWLVTKGCQVGTVWSLHLGFR